jgi:phage baseplate assembly protein V
MKNDYLRIAKIVKLEFVGQLGRVRVQFQDPNSLEVENGVLLFATGDNSCPSIDDICIVLGIGDEYAQNFVIPFDVINAPKILEGEKIIYGKKGNQVYLKQDGSINIITGDNKQIDITAQGGINITGAVNITGNVAITGNLSVSGTSDLQGTTTIETKPFISHTHSGVTIGAGNTGGVV